MALLAGEGLTDDGLAGPALDCLSGDGLHGLASTWRIIDGVAEQSDGADGAAHGTRVASEPRSSSGVFDGRIESHMTGQSPATTVTAGAGAHIVPPLILDGKDELLFFKTATHLEAYVEPIDLTNGEYGACWDSEGRLLDLYVDVHKRGLVGLLRVPIVRMRLQSTEQTPAHLADLHQALLRFMITLELEGSMPTTNDTADVLAFAIERAGWS